ncbi:hypothetical protein Y032_1145g3685 [Ancylostoma ceylanicum]|uniref:Uncharacterized protein n=1 Tax=Ancylostoma ceylanicum TaxID=53326 RepID=A0A016W5M5_9BILA|nr:hypothetical protein Y032_1145g3685 [Ancylostoma ceylanicum]
MVDLLLLIFSLCSLCFCVQKRSTVRSSEHMPRAAPQISSSDEYLITAREGSMASGSVGSKENRPTFVLPELTKTQAPSDEQQQLTDLASLEETDNPFDWKNGAPPSSSKKGLVPYHQYIAFA